MGIGLTVVVDKENAEKTIEFLKEKGETPYIIGEITEGSGEVVIK
jgi:phosphoribosylformylglycinamidine cyclo-ligase